MGAERLRDVTLEDIMVDVNLKLTVPDIGQLAKMTASGIGAVAGPMLGRWKARVEADAPRRGGAADGRRCRPAALGGTGTGTH